MRILLLRHGETDWNLQGRCQGVADIDLNDTGRYSSDLKRAIQTAEIIGGAHRLEVAVDGDFRELDHGAFEGLTFADIRTSYPDFLERWRSEPAELVVPGGERLVDVEKRAWKGIERVVQGHPANATVVVVSHNFPILTVLCRITGTPLNGYRTFRVAPCELRSISYDSKAGWSILQMAGGDGGSAAPNKGTVSLG
ncbi:MAG: histidine phosphatase family protein [Deltaproteobacteria bacterium]|nr:histidine phosphatase family protein [Deltaproteobacteria bacterium]